jgi:hypothetical protein
MRKFLIKTVLITLAIGALFVWFRTDASVLAGASALGMDDSSGWTAANSHIPEVMDTLEAARAGMMQIALPWDSVELSPGAFTWSVETEEGLKDYNMLFSRMNRHGIKPVVILGGSPIYLSHLYPQQPIFRDQLLENWENYVRAAVQEFGSDVDYWQVGNVINDPAAWGALLFPGAEGASAPPDPELYGEMLRIAHSVIKSEQASDTVLLGELGFNGDCVFHPVNYLQTLSDMKLWYAFDAVSLRLSVLDANPEEAVIDTCGNMPVQLSGIPGADSIRAVADLAELNGGKPVWVHNLRFANDFLSAKANQRGTLQEVTASDFLARASGLYMAYGKAERIFWSFVPQRNTPGLIAMQTFANLSGSLSGRYDGSNLPAGTDAFALRFRGSGKLSLLAWFTHGGEEGLPMVIGGVDGYDLHAFSADSASLKTRNGVGLPVDNGGSTALLVSERPVLISGRPSNIKQTVTQTVEDSAAQASAGLQAKLHNWMQAQKAKTAAKVSGWVADQQASLLDTLRITFEDWLRKSLGLA